jgi:hypothetical protein
MLNEAQQTMAAANEYAWPISWPATKVDLPTAFQRYETMRKFGPEPFNGVLGRPRALHLFDDARAISARDSRLPCFPDEFGWIHAFDATHEATRVTG